MRKRTLLNLSHWPAEHVEGLRGVLKGGVVMPPGEQPFVIERSLPHGHVAAVLGATRAIGLDKIIVPKATRETDPESCRPVDLVLAMIVSRIIAPASKLATARALDPATAASSLGVELALGDVREDEFYAALDWLLERQGPIQTALAKRHLKGGTLVLYDVCRAVSKAAAAPWPNAATTATARRGSCRSSMAFCARPTAAFPSPSRCSKATPAIP